MMTYPVSTFAEVTEYGKPVPARDDSHLDLDKATAEALEQRFLKHGTLVITQEGVVLQATKVRGGKATREIYFAASESSAHAVVKAKPSEAFASDSVGGFSHVFMNVLGQEFTARVADGAADSNHGAMSFAIAGLVAGAKDKAVQSGSALWL